MHYFINDFFLNSIKVKKQLFLIAGPCVIESEKMCLEHAAAIRDICNHLSIPFIFKSSYDKANRTSINSFRGPGISKGLDILKKISKQIGVPVTSDVHGIDEVRRAKEVLDIIQIPALLSRQTDLILCAAKSGKIVNVKKGQFMAPADMQNIISKIESVGNKKIMLTERGSCFGYNNLISDMRSIVIMHEFGYPVVFDATHSVQLPSAGGSKSLGESRFASVLALSAVAAGCDGLFIEVHKDPKKALCDGPNMIDFSTVEKLLVKAKKIMDVINE
ncbi:MAG: 3-deoxy-8-phosphooctulonate synthase [Candidatus Omnitrophota bacterium]|nr:MAG: 3-deoxy-8-phosphooctulonate synthase [Candidatus Omnitrophota bacterium]